MKTKQAMTLVFAMQLRYMFTYNLVKYRLFLFSMPKSQFLENHQDYSSRFCQKLAFLGRKWNQTIFC